MKLPKKIVNQFNLPSTMVVLSSFPSKGGEVAVDNAISRYTKLLLSNYPKTRNVIVISEKRSKVDKPYFLNKNIFVIPTYRVNSPFLFWDIQKILSQFNSARFLMIQFEFSIFGGKMITNLFPLFLAFQKLMGRKVSIMLHQVVYDLGRLSGHLGLNKKSVQTKFYNMALGFFYIVTGIFADKILVHDSILKKRLAHFMDESKIYVIPHGSHGVTNTPSSLREIARSQMGITAKEFVVLAFGYQSWYKGTDWITKTIGEIVKTKQANITLVVAGGTSPTLKNTKAYDSFVKKLEQIKEEYKQNIIFTGFVPEAEVENIFAASDLIVFPYRARMSASGALSLAWQYKKPFLVSRSFASNFLEEDVSYLFKVYNISRGDVVFRMNKTSFETKLFALMQNKYTLRSLSILGGALAQARSWQSMAKRYDTVVCTHAADGSFTSVETDLSLN